MLPFINRFSSDDDKLTSSAFLYKGGKLGVGASMLGSFLFLCFYITISSVSAELRNVGFVSDSLRNTDELLTSVIFLTLYFTLGFLVTSLLSMIPGIIGGIGHAFILAILARSRKLTFLRGMISGALVASIISLIPLYIGENFLRILPINISAEEEMLAMTEFMVSGILAAMVAGAWHGWRMILAMLKFSKS